MCQAFTFAAEISLGTPHADTATPARFTRAAFLRPRPLRGRPRRQGPTGRHPAGAIATDRRAVHQADLPEHAEVFGVVPAGDTSTDACTDITAPVALPPRQRSRHTEMAAGTNPTGPKGSSK
jgi:hypothetical protein